MIFHRPNDEGEYTDEQLMDHLITSDCSECVKAGFRLKELLEEIEGLRELQT